MSEISSKLGFRPRWESLKNVYNDLGFILRGEVVLVGVETSLLDRTSVVNDITGEVDTAGMVEEAVTQYISSAAE